MIVVDSSVWISLLRMDDNDAVSRLHSFLLEEDILVGDAVLLEVLQGARSDKHASWLERSLRQYLVVPMLSPDMATKAATNYRRLRGHGVTIRKSNDLIIGTFCIEHGFGLLHTDRDFDPMAKYLGLITV